MLTTSRTPMILSAIVVAVGVAIAWAFVCGIGGQLIRGFFGPTRTASESLHIALDGTVMIVSMSSGNNYEGHRIYRTLDGKEVKLADEESGLYPRSLANTPQQPAIISYEHDWKQRIGSTTDYGNPASYWFIVRDDTVEGHAYFVAFDATTKRQIGFLDRNGFHETQPLSSGLFDLHEFWAGYDPPFYASTGYMEWPNIYPNFRYTRASSEALPPQWVVFLLDEGRIWRIDLRERSLSTFNETSDAISISMIYEPVLAQKTDVVDGEVVRGDVGSAESRRKTVQRLAVRHRDRIEVWNPIEGTNRVYPLPERAREQGMLSAISLGNGQLLLQYNRGRWERGTRQELIWLAEGGKEVRSESLELVGYVPTPPREKAWQLAGIAPVPALWGFYEFIGHPFEFVQHHQEPTYRSAMARTWNESWPAFVTVLLISAIAAGIVWRWHQLAFRPGGALWSVFVFLLGLPGLVAYWLYYRGAPVAGCESCGKVVPRNRDSCAACAEPFPEPMLKGTEIFA